MRAIINIVFQLILACSLLLCITCNRPSEKVKSNKSGEIKIKDDAFIISQIKNACDLIELAEIGEKKGTVETSLHATMLKNDQMTVLYLFTDFANERKIRIPIARQDDIAKKLYLQSERFDEEWNEVITQRARQTINHLEDYYLHADKESRMVIADVLATIQPENL